MLTYTPGRGRGVELLDDPRVDAETRIRALRDVARANAYFGGTRVVLKEVLAALSRQRSRSATVLDVGSGTGDIAVSLRAAGRRRGIGLTIIGLDSSDPLARTTSNAGVPGICGDALFLPFTDRSVDIVVCSQLLHHFTGDEAVALLRELDRVARRCVVVCDLRRSRVAAAAFWLVAPLLRFHRVSRHDGVVSVLRAFTPSELRTLVHVAVGRAPELRRHIGFRLAALWVPACTRDDGKIERAVLR